MTIAHVVLSLDPGGTEKLVLDLARRCAEQRQGTRVICLDRQGEWAPQLAGDGIPVEVVGRRPGFDWRVARGIARLCAAHQIDVLHCHQYSPFVYGAMAGLFRPRLGIVFTEHGRLSDAPPSRRRATANRVLAPLVSSIAAVSGELRDFMVAEGFPGRRIDVIHNGIDPGPLPSPATRAAARTAAGLSPDDFVVGTAARLDPVKNLAVAIRAIAELRARTGRGVFVVIGDGPEKDALLAEAAQHPGIDVRWLGYRTDVRALLPAFDVYLNTSTSEGVSVTILEAMAAGVPVVATAVGGTPEVVANRTGILVPSGDAHACAAALERLAGAPALAAGLGRAGRGRLETHFTADRMVGRYMAAYQAAAGKHGTH